MTIQHTARLSLYLIIAAFGLSSQAAADDKEKAAFMAKLLQSSMATADLAAHIKIRNIVALKKTGGKTLYYVEAKVLKKYFGRIRQRLVFHLWAETKFGQADIGSERIVSLRRNPQDGQYYAVENGSIITATPALIEAAATAVHSVRGRGIVISAKHCESGSYAQPGGDYALQIYCDDGLATNVAVQLLRMNAPMLGAYSLTRRSWHGGDWAGDITSYLWGRNKDKLYIATSPYNGTGNVYELNLPEQKSRLIWQRGKKDCIALLQNQKAAHLLLQVGHCDNKTRRQVRLKLN
jgi:hypothetical protein